MYIIVDVYYRIKAIFVEIYYSDQAVKQLRKIMSGDKKSAQKIVDKIQLYADDSATALDIKHLKGKSW